MISVKDRIIQTLIEEKLISENTLREALKFQRENGGQLSRILVKLDFVKEDELLAALAKVFGKPSIDISRFKIDRATFKIVPLNVCRQYQIVPISVMGDTLTLAMADPLNILALDEVKGLTGYKINPIIATAGRIMQAIDQAYNEVSSKAAIEDLIQNMPAESIELIPAREEEVISQEDLSRLIRQGPIISFVNKIMEQAVSLKSSDILIEPQENNLRIRFRVDGLLREQSQSDKSMGPLVVSRVKVISGLDIAEHRLPQDGRIKMSFAEKEVDFRVSVLPSIHGEKVVIRVLDKSQLNLDIGKLGFQDNALINLRQAISKPYGMVLICGPTGSGKTTTLYSLLKLADKPRLNIITVEDPVEFQLAGINQVNVRADIGLTFASVLRSVLRQDPNIIMVGEIRDSETADIAVKSALTGHLVFSTLHTITAAAAAVRLIDMGIEPFLINSALICIGAQRLVRVLCPYCKEGYRLNSALIERLKPNDSGCVGEAVFFRPRGCLKCFKSGYQGRLVLGEVLVLSPAIKDLILNRSQEQAIKNQARSEGMQTLREDGLLKAASGVTSLEEILRITAADD